MFTTLQNPTKQPQTYTKCTPTKVHAILIYHDNEKMSWNDIFQQPLFAGTTTSKNTIKRHYHDAKAHGESCYWTGRTEKHGGRPWKISRKTLEEVTNQFDEGGLRNRAHAQRHCFPDVSEHTVHQSLSEVGYKGFVQPTKPLLKPEHVTAYWVWWQAHVTWESPELFNQNMVLFLDEKKFKFQHSDGRRYCRRKKGEGWLDVHRVQKRTAHGVGKGKDKGSVLVWGCIGPCGAGPIVQLSGLVNSDQYIDVLEENLLPFLTTLPPRHPDNFFFQQDNDSKHKSKKTTKWLTDHNIPILCWPANSPDLSPIENAWSKVQRHVHLKYPDLLNSDQYFEAIKEEWHSPDFQKYVRHLYQSFPHCLIALHENNFMWIDYWKLPEFCIFEWFSWAFLGSIMYCICYSVAYKSFVQKNVDMSLLR